MSTLFLFLFALLGLIFSAFFSGMEIAFISSSKLKIELDNKKGQFSAKILSFFSSKPAWFIAAMLIGNNIALVIYTLYVAELIEPYLTSLLNISNETSFLSNISVISFIIKGFLRSGLSDPYFNKASE